jgi:hypothetical protein
MKKVPAFAALPLDGGRLGRKRTALLFCSEY